MCAADMCERPVLARGWCAKHYQRWRMWRGDPEQNPRARRFWQKVDTMADGCWLWRGVIDRHGYGQVGVGQRDVRAHRWAWEDRNGPIPPGLVLDHLCRVRHCVNPEHLEPVTVRENLRRGIDPNAAKRAMTHCKRGHEFSAANTYVWARRPNIRQCRACRRKGQAS